MLLCPLRWCMICTSRRTSSMSSWHLGAGDSGAVRGTGPLLRPHGPAVGRGVARGAAARPPRSRQLALGDGLAGKLLALAVCDAGGAKLAASQHFAQDILARNILRREAGRNRAKQVGARPSGARRVVRARQPVSQARARRALRLAQPGSSGAWPAREAGAGQQGGGRKQLDGLGGQRGGTRRRRSGPRSAACPARWRRRPKPS